MQKLTEPVATSASGYDLRLLSKAEVATGSRPR